MHFAQLDCSSGHLIEAGCNGRRGAKAPRRDRTAGKSAASKSASLAYQPRAAFRTAAGRTTPFIRNGPGAVCCFRILAADAQSVGDAHVDELIGLAARLIDSGMQDGTSPNVGPLTFNRAWAREAAGTIHLTTASTHTAPWPVRAFCDTISACSLITHRTMRNGGTDEPAVPAQGLRSLCDRDTFKS
jgi:hypothetical protein